MKKKNKISVTAKIKSGTTSVKRAKDKNGKIVYRTNKGGRATREQWLQYRDIIKTAKAAKIKTADEAHGIILALPPTHHRNLTINTQALIMEKGYKVVIVNKSTAIAGEDTADLTGAEKIGSYGIENAYKLQALFNQLWKQKEKEIEEEEEEEETSAPVSPDITYNDIIDNQETKTLYININQNFKI
jgi:hypothetical protein